VIRGKAVCLVLGEDVVIGRTEGALHVASHAISRKHLRIAREGAAVVVRDLGTRNGTQLRRMNLVGAIPVPPSGAPIELMLGKEVRVIIALAASIEGGVTVEIGGDTFVAPLGRARIAGVPWELEMGADEWIELVANGGAAYLVDVSLAERTTLLVGDAVSAERGGPEVLRMASE
jgi:hypothetical protein